jgi:hypothetical protein
MRNFFDAKTYHRPLGMCPGCMRCLVTLRMSIEDRERYRCITEQEPREEITVNVAQDFGKLGLPTTDVPAKAVLCIRCACDYIEEFDRMTTVKRLIVGLGQSNSIPRSS